MNISVVIPVYNRPGLVRRAIDSVLRQTRPADEIIVVDDGSTDQTVEILKEFGNDILFLRQEHKGVSAARNLGMKVARGDWIALLDSDDEWLPEKLERQCEFHQKYPHLLISQCQEVWIRHGRRVNPKKKHQKYAGWIFVQSLPLCIISPSAVIFHRSVIEKVGNFDESFPVCEDYDLWLRVSRHFPVGLDERPGIIKYGGHADQLSRSYWGMDLYRVKAMEKHVYDKDLPGEWQKALLQEMLQKLEILIKGYQKRGKSCKELQEKYRNYSALLEEKILP